MCQHITLDLPFVGHITTEISSPASAIQRQIHLSKPDCCTQLEAATFPDACAASSHAPLSHQGSCFSGASDGYWHGQIISDHLLFLIPAATTLAACAPKTWHPGWSCGLAHAPLAQLCKCWKVG